MPYKRPPAKIKHLSKSKQEKWVKVFNSAYEYAQKKGWSKERVEEYAHRVAWASVKGSGKKKKVRKRG